MNKVTVIMPNYNHAPYLRERIDSILAQDYTDFEIILLDDASSDSSVDILRSYSADSHVKTLIVNQANTANTFLQWQRGLQLATGDYIWIAESDDVASPSFLSRAVSALEQNDAALAFCRSRWIDAEGSTIKRAVDPLWRRDFSMDGSQFVRRYMLGYSSICNASAVVFRRDLALNIDMQTISRYSASGDRLFWIEMALQGRVAYLAEPLSCFRQHTRKVSGGAEYQALNIIQDHDIYRLVSPRLQLTEAERRIICGYHWKAAHRPTVSPEGRRAALHTWHSEPEFGRLAFLFYLLHRAKEKC